MHGLTLFSIPILKYLQLKGKESSKNEWYNNYWLTLRIWIKRINIRELQIIYHLTQIVEIVKSLTNQYREKIYFQILLQNGCVDLEYQKNRQRERLNMVKVGKTHRRHDGTKSFYSSNLQVGRPMKIYQTIGVLTYLRKALKTILEQEIKTLFLMKSMFVKSKLSYTKK